MKDAQKRADKLRAQFLARMQSDNNLRADASQALKIFAKSGDMTDAAVYQLKLHLLQAAEDRTRAIEREWRAAMEEY